MRLSCIEKTGSGTVYSASCNADTAVQALSDFARMQENGHKTMTIGMVNSQLPYMYGDAELTAAAYDVIIDDPRLYHPLFGTPRPVINAADYMIGIHVSTLFKDGGTLQIGIGALGDSIAYALGLRQNNNAAYKEPPIWSRSARTAWAGN